MRRIIIYVIFVFTSLCSFSFVNAQEKRDSIDTLKSVTDTLKNNRDTFFLAKKKGWLGKLGKSMAIYDLLPQDSLLLAIKNNSPFIMYKGSIIRKIIVSKVGFGQSVNDTSKVNRSFLSDLGEKLHASTTETTIRNNLFIKAGDSLYPNLLADNERFLRNINYLQDARIVINQVIDENFNFDSVDVIVLYKDIFPFSGAITADNEKRYFLQVNNDNFMGTGQRISVQTLFDLDRKPMFGYGFEYMKPNIKGSFVNFTVGYQNQNRTFNNGSRQETSLYSRIELPLVSPYYLWTGAIETSLHYTDNDYAKLVSDSLYKSDLKYRYSALDAWVGYNVTGKHSLHENITTKTKYFIALRAVNTKFYEIPDKFKNEYFYAYANQTSFLSSLTIFKQEYYRNTFIFGFGRNEDVPEGINASAITGWTNKENYSRPYFGIDLQKNYFDSHKNYFNYVIRAGGYFYKQHLQDLSLLLSLESFTRLRKLGSSKWLMRHFINGSLTQQALTKLNLPLYLNSSYGLPEFSNPDTTGATRLTINLQTVFYNTWKFLDFSFAPFSYFSLSYLRPIGETIREGNVYSSIGGGVRTRNENLVFGTIELKIVYIPHTVANMSPWNIAVSSNLQFKYNSLYIKRPDFVPVN